MIPVIISHYTLNTPYEQEVQRLRKSLEKLGLENWLLGIPSLGSWRWNSNYCAHQIKDALAKFSDRNILRVDADAVFHSRPVLLESDDFKADVAAHIHDFRWHKNELLGGTLFFRNNERVRTLVDTWTRMCCETRREYRNGDLLQLLLKEHTEIQFSSLPATYCKIFDLMHDVRRPVIEHFQASRRFKKIINVVK